MGKAVNISFNPQVYPNRQTSLNPQHSTNFSPDTTGSTNGLNFKPGSTEMKMWTFRGIQETMQALVFISLLALGQTTTPMRVVQLLAEVRSGPGAEAKLYPTNQVRAGETVQVVEERPDGWIAIKPPQGSFSWVQMKHLQQVIPNQPNYLVQIPEGSKAPVYIGSSLQNSKPTIESAKLNRGAQVKAYGTAQVDGQETWLPIFPPENEVRFIRAEAVGKTAPKAAVTSTTPAVAPVMPAVPQGTTANGNAPGVNCDPSSRWGQAVAAEQSGNSTEAIRLYTQIGQDFACSQNGFASQATNRALWLRECQRVGTKNTAQICPPGQPRLVSLGAGQQAPVILANQTPPSGARAGSAPPPNQSKSPPVVNGNPLGVLRRAGRPSDYQTAYYLEGPNGRPLIYLMGAPGQNLDYFMNQRIEVSGPTTYRSDMRAYVMTVYQIQPRW